MGKKRKFKTDPVQHVYRDVTSIVARESTGRPGTPHSYFSSTHDVQLIKKEDNNKNARVVVHAHANGLCIVALGVVDTPVESIDYVVTPAPDGNASERRKRAAALLKSTGSTTDLPGAVTPTTILANLKLQDGTIQPVPAGVWGIVVELNDNMSPALLQRDALLDGYIAILQTATGSYPPRSLELLEDGMVVKKVKTEESKEGVVKVETTATKEAACME